MDSIVCIYLTNIFFLYLSQWQCCFYIKTTSGCLVIATFYISPVKELFRFRTELNLIIRFHETNKSFFFLFINMSLALKGLCHLTFLFPFNFDFVYICLQSFLSFLIQFLFCFHLSFFFIGFFLSVVSNSISFLFPSLFFLYRFCIRLHLAIPQRLHVLY